MTVVLLCAGRRRRPNDCLNGRLEDTGIGSACRTTQGSPRRHSTASQRSRIGNRGELRPWGSITSSSENRLTRGCPEAMQLIVGGFQEHRARVPEEDASLAHSNQRSLPPLTCPQPKPPGAGPRRFGSGGLVPVGR